MRAMENADRGGRTLPGGMLVGAKAEAAARRKSVQHGVAAAGRKGKATQLGHARRAKTKEDVAIDNEVERAMKKNKALVQASVEHLETAERSWDRYVENGGIVIRRYPTPKQVVTYMAKMSRERQRMCLAQRGKRRKGVQKGSVRNYVAEMGNNLWDTKYPAFGKLPDAEQKRYWAQIFGAYKRMYAAASQPASP